MTGDGWLRAYDRGDALDRVAASLTEASVVQTRPGSIERLVHATVEALRHGRTGPLPFAGPHYIDGDIKRHLDASDMRMAALHFRLGSEVLLVRGERDAAERWAIASVKASPAHAIWWSARDAAARNCRVRALRTLRSNGDTAARLAAWGAVP